MHFEKIMNTLYSFAAAVVIFGAWAKLEHQEYGGLALTIGMLVESGIFVIYGFAEWREQRQSAPPTTAASASSAMPPVTTMTPVTPATTSETSVDPDRIDELQQTMEKTNGMLQKIFRASEH